jgi:hypothetical protein
VHVHQFAHLIARITSDIAGTAPADAVQDPGQPGPI